MNNELRERIAEQIIKWYGNFAKTGYPEKLADQILALLPPRLSEEEIFAEINKYGYWKNGVEWDFWKRGIARSLAGRIEKPIVEEKECEHDNVRIANHWECRKCGLITHPHELPKPNQYEHTKIEKLNLVYDNKKDGRLFELYLCYIIDKINELIQDREKLWEAIEKLRKE